MPPFRSTRGKHKRKDHGIDIEALAQQKPRYFIAHAEETEFLAADPTARDKAIAELYQNSNMKTGFPCAETFVGPDDDPDVFLKAVDEVLDKPPKTIEQRVIRFHVAVSGLVVFNEKKLYPALTGHSDLEDKVLGRSHQMSEWASKNLPPPFESHVSAIPTQEPPNPTPPPSRVPGSSSTRLTPMTSDMAEAFLAEPISILNKKFVHEANTPDSGTGAWEIESYTTKKYGEVVYNVLFEDCDDPIQHDADGMRVLLRDSHILL